MQVLRVKEFVRGRERLGWTSLVLAAGVVVLIAGAWTAKTASVAPTRCSASDNHIGRTIRKGGWERYCGPGRAVLRVDGKVFRIRHGFCDQGGGRIKFGLVGWGPNFPHGRGMELHMSPVMNGSIQAGHNGIQDGEVQLPGYGSLPHQGRAIVAKNVTGGTFSLGRRAHPAATGHFSCG